MKNKYDIVYSIGHDCACSMYLRKHNLRVVSGPLDWLTSVPAHNRFDLLLNDFEGFMNQDDFQFVEKNPNIVNDDKCDYYKNTRTGLYFYHDFPVNVPLGQSFPDVEKKYKRRIDRFYQNIKNTNVFCWCGFRIITGQATNSGFGFYKSSVRKWEKILTCWLFNILKTNINPSGDRLLIILLSGNYIPSKKIRKATTQPSETKNCAALYFRNID